MAAASVRILRIRRLAAENSGLKGPPETRLSWTFLHCICRPHDALRPRGDATLSRLLEDADITAQSISMQGREDAHDPRAIFAQVTYPHAQEPRPVHGGRSGAARRQRYCGPVFLGIGLAAATVFFLFLR
jgi:hypothetical protein